MTTPIVKVFFLPIFLYTLPIADEPITAEINYINGKIAR